MCHHAFLSKREVSRGGTTCSVCGRKKQKNPKKRWAKVSNKRQENKGKCLLTLITQKRPKSCRVIPLVELTNFRDDNKI